MEYSVEFIDDSMNLHKTKTHEVTVVAKQLAMHKEHRMLSVLGLPIPDKDEVAGSRNNDELSSLEFSSMGYVGETCGYLECQDANSPLIHCG